MKILVVNALLNEIRSLRSAMGGQHEIWSASSLQTAPTLIKSFKPDAVVLFIGDLNPAYPILIRSIQIRHDCPVLALAPFTHMKLIHQVLDWGVDSFLSSPCDMSRIKGRLESLHEHQTARLSQP